MLMIKKEIEGKEKFLIQQRVKNPNYGFYGFPTGKVRWGETIPETAKRECLEETGIEGEFVARGVYHEHTFLDNPQELIEDKLFFICASTSIRGELKPSFEGGINQWMTLDEFLKQDKRFSSAKLELELLNTEKWLTENSSVYNREKF